MVCLIFITTIIVLPLTYSVCSISFSGYFNNSSINQNDSVETPLNSIAETLESNSNPNRADLIDLLLELDNLSNNSSELVLSSTNDSNNYLGSLSQLVDTISPYFF